VETARKILRGAEAQNRNLTDAERKDFDGLVAKAEDIEETLKRAGVLGQLRAELDKPIGPAIPYTQEQGGMIYVPRNMNPGEVRAYRSNEAIAEAPYGGPGLGAYVRGIVTGRWNGAEELRALAEGSTPGSYLVPTPLAGAVIDLVRNQTQVIRAGAVT